MSAVTAREVPVTVVKKWRKPWRIVLIVVASAFVLATAFVLWPKIFPPHVPRLQLSVAALELGEGMPGEELSGHFDIRNGGAETLTFQLRASCGCTNLAPESGELAAGETQRVDVGLRLPGILGTEKKAAVFIHSNDPSVPDGSLQLHAGCPFPFQVTPSRIQLERNSGTTIFEQRLTVEENGQLEFREIGELKINCPQNCRVTSVRRDGKQLQVDLAIDAGSAPGDTKFFIDLGHVNDSRQMHVPVHVGQSELALAVPKKQTVQFDAAEQVKEIHTWIVAKNGKKLEEVTPVAIPAGVEVVPQTRQGGKVGYTVRIHKSMLTAETFTLKFRCHTTAGDCELAQDIDVRRS